MVCKKVMIRVAVLSIFICSLYSYAFFEELTQKNPTGYDDPVPGDRPNLFDYQPDDKRRSATYIENRRDLEEEYPDPNKTYLNQPYAAPQKGSATVLEFPDQSHDRNKTRLLDDADLRPYQGGTLDMPYLDGRS